MENGYARSGIGGQLMSSAIQESAGDARPAKVVLEVWKSNDPAINFYLKFSFKIAGERKNYYSNLLEDAFVMELEISDHRSKNS